MKQTLC